MDEPWLLDELRCNFRPIGERTELMIPEQVSRHSTKSRFWLFRIDGEGPRLAPGHDVACRHGPGDPVPLAMIGAQDCGCLDQSFILQTLNGHLGTESLSQKCQMVDELQGSDRPLERAAHQRLIDLHPITRKAIHTRQRARSEE